MKKESKKQPKLRFPGFINDWKESKLSEMSTIKTGPFGTQLSAKEYVEVGVPVINVKNIGNNSIIEENLDYVSANTALRLQDHTLLSGDIVFGRKGALNRHAIIRKEQEGWLQGSDCIRVRTNENINSDYVNSYLQTSRVAQHLVRSAYGSTMLTLTTDMISSIPVLLPEKDEQNQIGELFKRIENYIKLHQRRYAQLELLKKGLLQKLFSQEVRFKADDGSDFPEWEEHEIAELIQLYNEKVPSDCQLPILTSSKKNGIEYQEEHFAGKQSHDIEGYNVLPRNYCTYRNRSDGTDFTFNINKLCDKGIVSKFYPVFKENDCDLFFLVSLLNNERKTIRKIAYTAKGTGQKVLSITDLRNITVDMPLLPEQQKIADCLSSLDEVIEKQKATLAAWEELKKGLLQQMFV